MISLTIAGALALFVLLTATNGNLKPVGPQRQCRCEAISLSICASHFHTRDWYGRFPNGRGQNLTRAEKEFIDFYQFLALDNYCSHMLYNLLCFHYFPKCEGSRPELGAIPCREACNEALTSCTEHARALQPSYTFPDHLNCSNFPPRGSSDDSGRVVEAAHCDFITACPNASIHVEFATDAGKTVFYGNESVEICLRLANVGSYDPDAGLAENVTVEIISPAEVAQYVTESRNLVFPVGAEKGNIRCTMLYINRGSRVKFFRVSASVVSPSGAIISGDIASTTDSITVKILDQCNKPAEPGASYNPALSQEPEIPRNKCRSVLCNWRTNISRNTFTDNHYSFVARVQVVDTGNSVLEVYMLQCRNITCGVCPKTPVCTKLATCPNCQLDGHSVGKEFIIAGGHTERGSLFIGNNRKKGLLSSDHSGRWLDYTPPDCK